MFSVSTDDNFIVSRSTLYENIHDFLSESSLSSMLTGMVGTLVEHTVYDLSLPSTTQVSWFVLGVVLSTLCKLRR